jgi:hypothetical protein
MLLYAMQVTRNTEYQELYEYMKLSECFHIGANEQSSISRLKIFENLSISVSKEMSHPL